MKRSPMPPRTTALKSTGFARATSIEAREVAKLIKMRTRKCAIKGCAVRFTPRSMSHKTCSPECAQSFVAMEKVRKDRKDRQEGLAKLKTARDWIKTAQISFNAFVRERDKNQPCICCGRFPKNDQLTGGSWDAGHYRSIGSAPHLRFVEINCHRQMKHCNRDGAGRAVDYRVGLIARIGLAAVESLESDQSPRKYTIDELKAITAMYREKLKALKSSE